MSIIKGNTLVLLTHGYTKASETDMLLEYHSKMTPGFTVLMLDWKSKVHSSWWGYVFYFSTAKFASSLEINSFLIHFSNFSVSCIGHSLGAHVCGSICRNFKNVSGWCDRIVGLDVASPGFWKKGDELVANRLDKNDARYVAAVMTSTKIGGLSDHSFAHEYITSNIDGREISECPSYGKFSSMLCGTNVDYIRVCVNFSIGNGLGFSCSHSMAVLIFAKSLDIFSSLSVVGLERFNSSLVISSWNGYTMSTDARFPFISGGWVASNESAYYPLNAIFICVNSSDNILINTDYGKMERVAGMNGTWVVFAKDAVDRSYFRFEFNTSDVGVNWIRVHKSRIIPINGKLEIAQVYKESRNCKIDKFFEVICVIGKDTELTIVPRNTSVTYPFDGYHCRYIYQFSNLNCNRSFTMFGQTHKEIRIYLGSNYKSLDYVLINGEVVINWGFRCNRTKFNVNFEEGVLVLKFTNVGMYVVIVHTPFTKTSYTILIGKPTITRPTLRMVIKKGESVTLHAFSRVCSYAKWYKNGIGVGVGCNFVASSDGYYKFITSIGNRYVIEGDFNVSIQYDRFWGINVSMRMLVAVLFTSLSIGLCLGVSVVMMIFYYFRRF